MYGSLLYAGSRTLQAHLPDPAGTEAPVVILRLRGRTSLGATFIKVAGGQLYLSGLQPSLTERLRRTRSIDGPVRAFEATPVIGESTPAAYLDAEAWLVKRQGTETPAADRPLVKRRSHFTRRGAVRAPRPGLVPAG